MIESSKNSTENYPRKCFWTQEKETRVKRWSAFEQLGPANYGFLKTLVGICDIDFCPPALKSSNVILSPVKIDFCFFNLI